MRISGKKRDKILEQIISLLYSNHPKPLFTSFIASEVARDEEFAKGLMLELKGKGIVSEIRKNPKGVEYSKRRRWILSDSAYWKYAQISGST